MKNYDWMYAFAERMYNRMKDKDMSQKDLAIKSGLTEVSISRYINRQRIPNAMDTSRIAKALDCKSDDLIMFDET